MQNVPGATVSCWILRTALVAIRTIYATTYSTGGARVKLLLQLLATDIVRVSARRIDTDVTSTVDSLVAIPIALTHVAGRARFTGQALDVFINGVLNNTTAIAGWVANNSNLTTSNNAIGFNIGTATQPYGGNVQDLRVYNRALSDTEINDIYLARGRDSNFLGLFNRWNLIERFPGAAVTATSVKDSDIGQLDQSIVNNVPTYAEYLIGGTRRRRRS